MTVRLPNSEVVAVAWLRSLVFPTGLVAGVSTSLPSMGTLTGGTVFLMVNTISGAVDTVVPWRRPLEQIDAFAKHGLDGEVMQALELIRDYCSDPTTFGVRTPKTGFAPINLLDVSPRSEPRLFRSDPAELARATMDISFTYFHLSPAEIGG